MVSMVLLRFISGTFSRVARGQHVVEALACYYYSIDQPNLNTSLGVFPQEQTKYERHLRVTVLLAFTMFFTADAKGQG